MIRLAGMRHEIHYQILMPVQKPAPLLTSVQFVAALLIGILLMPAGAHLAEMAHKLALPPDEYMTVQNIYRGWALFGIPVVLALVATLLLTILLRRNRAACLWSAFSFLCLAVSQAIFWTYTWPMNRLSRNWTVMPEPFEEARRQWEYSHAANAGLTFLAFCALLLAILASRGLALPAQSPGPAEGR